MHGRLQVMSLAWYYSTTPLDYIILSSNKKTILGFVFDLGFVSPICFVDGLVFNRLEATMTETIDETNTANDNETENNNYHSNACKYCRACSKIPKVFRAWSRVK